MAAPSQRQENLARGSLAQAEAGSPPPHVLVQYQSDKGPEYSALALARPHTWSGSNVVSGVTCISGGREDVSGEEGEVGVGGAVVEDAG